LITSTSFNNDIWISNTFNDNIIIREETMDLGLKDKVALVTGSGSQTGFGKGIATCLAKEGCDLILVDIDLEGVRKTAVEIEALGRKAIALKADITNYEEVNNMVRSGFERFGKIDILVNNAGKSHIPSFLEATEEDWHVNIDINLKGTWHCCRAVIPKMLERKSGKIVSISSVVKNSFVSSVRNMVKTGRPARIGSTLYLAAKAGIIGLTRSLAIEVGPSGINVNGIVPGLGDTGLYTERGGLAPMIKQQFASKTPMRRLTTPQDIGNAVLFLVSDLASDITGQTIQVDSGDTMV
jgi:NAD(P)-dependent dehydrogenase (short-subunit alcohol dehydrogenase family)